MGSIVSSLIGEKESADDIALKAYFTRDMELFNKAIQGGAKLEYMSEMDRGFLKEIAHQHQIEYPRRVVEFADQASDREITKKILRNYLKHESGDASLLKIAIMNEDAQSVQNILQSRPSLSNKRVPLNEKETLALSHVLREVRNNYETKSPETQLSEQFKRKKEEQMIFVEPSQAVTVKPLDIALYKAFEKTFDYDKNQSKQNDNSKIVKALIDAGADYKNKMYMEFSFVPEIFSNNPNLGALFINYEKVKPLDFAKEFTKNDVFSILKEVSDKDNKGFVNMFSRKKDIENPHNKKAELIM